jgi:hypothetical protein
VTILALLALAVNPAASADQLRHSVRHPASVSARGTLARQPHIVGGADAAQGQWGFMAFVAHFDSSGNPDFSCSGTLVSQDAVLTAGHCAVDETTGATLDPSGYRVVTGAVDWTDTTDRQVNSVSHVLVYPYFDPVGPKHDAALLILTSPVSEASIPVWGSGGLSAGIPAWIAGWGFLDSAQTDTTRLQWAPTVVQSVAFCRHRFFRGYPYDPYSDLCTLDVPTYDTATCQGDSGGPLLAQDAAGKLLEIGLTSVGPSDCNSGYPDYFTAIQPIASWVKNEISGVGSSSVTFESPLEMKFAAARSYVRQTLAHLFGRAFQRRHVLAVRCTRISSIRVRCNFGFLSGPNDYFGHVVVYDYYDWSAGTTYWASNYQTYRVNNHCLRSRHWRSCRTHPRKGSW